jgi:hypothetical protein
MGPGEGYGFKSCRGLIGAEFDRVSVDGWNCPELRQNCWGFGNGNGFAGPNSP